MTHIYYSYIHERDHAFLMNEALPMFPKHYRDKVKSFRHWKDAQLSLLGNLLLKYGLEQRDEIWDATTIFLKSNNKPSLGNSALEYNISHSGDIAVCAISDYCEIGVDIEKLRNVAIIDFKAQMTPYEWGSVCDSNNPVHAFFSYWTQKEAVLKAHGSGMSTPLKSFENKNLETYVNDTAFFLSEIIVDSDYCCHLAFQGKSDPHMSKPLLVSRTDLFPY